MIVKVKNGYFTGRLWTARILGGRPFVDGQWPIGCFWRTCEDVIRICIEGWLWCEKYMLFSSSIAKATLHSPRIGK